MSPRAIAPFYAMEMAREANRRTVTGERIVRFDVGQPAWGAPPQALAAAGAAMANDTLGYTDSLGDPGLRSAIADWYRRRYGVAVAAERVVITTGASGAFQLAFLSLLGDGDGVALARPGYPPYRQILNALGFQAIELEGRAEDGFQLTAGLLREAPSVRAALVASPANPTGAIAPAHTLADLAQACAQRGAILISDEIYHGLAFAHATPTALSFAPDAIVINSFSKYWGMTGWRVGWLIAPEALIAPIERLAQNLTICPPAIAQAAAKAALADDDWSEARAASIGANRRVLLARLPGLGLPPVAPPDGAFYMLLDISAHGVDSDAFCAAALARAGVALTPGRDFDPDRGHNWVRLAYARSHAEIEEGLARLQAWLH